MRLHSTLVDQPDPREHHERAEALRDMLQSLGWQIAARPALAERAEHIAKRLCAGVHMELEEMRELQIEWKLLRMMLDMPEEFFRNKRGTE